MGNYLRSKQQELVSFNYVIGGPDDSNIETVCLILKLILYDSLIVLYTIHLNKVIFPRRLPSETPIEHVVLYT